MTNDTQRPLILASGSPRRRELLAKMGYTFETCSPDVDEHVEGLARDIVMTLARRKALAAAERYDRGVIIASDTLVSLDGVPLGKAVVGKRYGVRDHAIAHVAVGAVGIAVDLGGVADRHPPVRVIRAKANALGGNARVLENARGHDIVHFGGDRAGVDADDGADLARDLSHNGARVQAILHLKAAHVIIMSPYKAAKGRCQIGFVKCNLHSDTSFVKIVVLL